MEATMAYQKLKQIFPHHLENINLFQISPKDIDTLIPKNLPHIPMSRLHSLCRSQEKNVMNKVLEVKQMDLYDQMAMVCPNQDLKLMRTYSHEQVNQKIHHYSSQIALNQDKEAHSSTDDGDEEVIKLEDDMEIQQQHQVGQRYNNGLRNIFQEYDNNFSWYQLNVYDLH